MRQQRNTMTVAMRHLKVLPVVLLAAGLGFAKNPKIAKDLGGVDPAAQVNVIVQFVHGAAAGDGKVQGKGGAKKAALDLIGGSLYSISAGQLADLDNDPEVAYISSDRSVSGTLEYAEPTVRANLALQYGWTGARVGVAVIDSGIMASHPDLQNGRTSRVVYAQSFLPNDSSTGDPYGHGTHVAGIVGGNATQSTGGNYIFTFLGIAPKVNFIDLRVLDGNGTGTDSAVIAGIQQAINLKSRYNIRIINLSLGRPAAESYTLDPLCQAVEQAWKAGIVVVVAAGNNGRDNSMKTFGYSTITAPGNDPYVITVGAMKDMQTLSRADDEIASYSSKGPTLYDHIVKPDLVAPGNRIVSALADRGSLLKNYPANAVPVGYYEKSYKSHASSSYLRLSGTSMATPMVSGAAALLLEKDPSLTPDAVKARLMKTATKSFPLSSVATDPVTGATYVSTYDVFTVGAGYLDAWAALNSTDALSSGMTAVSPTAVYNATTGLVSILTGQNVVWGDNVVWGTGQTTAEALSVALDGEN